LAARLVPVYQDPDPDRYLANLSALQMVAGNYSAADESRQSLRERRRRTNGIRPVARDIIFRHLRARARTGITRTGLNFADAFAKSYREVAGRLNDRDAYTVNAWFRASPLFYKEVSKSCWICSARRTASANRRRSSVRVIVAYLYFDALPSLRPFGR